MLRASSKPLVMALGAIVREYTSYFAVNGLNMLAAFFSIGNFQLLLISMYSKCWLRFISEVKVGYSKLKSLF
jgi:hypothetical protein